MTAETAGSVAKRHDALWFNDGNIVLQAENTLFCVHRSVLQRESQLFSDMFAVPQPNDGSHGPEENPIPLHQVGANAMANILTMLYTAAGVHLQLDNAACLAVLKAAHRLQFQNVWGSFAPLLPGRLTAEEKLYLGLSGCGVDDWALPAFHKLIFGYDTHDCGGVDGAPLLGHASWNIIYSIRDKVLFGRIAAANIVEGSTLCAKHLKNMCVLLCSRADTASVRERLPPSHELELEPRCDTGQTCCAHQISSTMRMTLTSEEDLISAAWTKLKSDYTP